MIDNISLFDMEDRFQDVRALMTDVRTRNQEYIFKEGRLVVFIPGYVMVVECVDSILIYSLIHKKNWDKMQVLIEEFGIDYQSLVCFANANNWGVSTSLHSMYSTYSLTMSNAQHVLSAGIDLENIQVNLRVEPTIFGDVLYTLVGCADTLADGEFGVSDTVTIYGIFNDLNRLRDTFRLLRDKMANAEENEIREARHKFAIHPFIPNRCFGFGTEVFVSFFIE